MARPADIRKKAENLIQRATDAQRGRVATLWQRSDESDAAFASRVAEGRGRLPASSGLVAVASPNVSVPGVRAVSVPSRMLGIFSEPARYRVCYGGRGAGRSWGFARALLVRALERPTRFLCGREYMNSLSDSVHTLLSDQIELLGLGPWFDVKNTEITSRNGSSVIYAGLKTNVSKLKSAEGIDVCWIEEAESVSQASWDILTPTIRKPGSEVWATFNPCDPEDPLYNLFATGNPPPNAVVVKTTFADNPWFAEPLLSEMEYKRQTDDDGFRHVWLGECFVPSDAIVFKGKYASEPFTPQPHWDGPYYGLDLGWSADPTALTKCWIADNRLYVEKEAWKLRCDTDRLLTEVIAQIPGAQEHVIRVDNSRPETISYLQQHGVPQCTAVEKWPDSVRDGITRIRAFEKVVIHPDCKHTLEEFRLYSYKTNKAGDPLPELKPGNDHCIDSIRYGIAPIIRAGGAPAFLQFLGAQQKQIAAADAQEQDRRRRRAAVITNL